MIVLKKGKVQKQIRTFGTTTRELMSLREWLLSEEYLKTTLVEAANAAAKANGTYLRDKFYRLKSRRGYKRAAVAVARKNLGGHLSHVFPPGLLHALKSYFGAFSQSP